MYNNRKSLGKLRDLCLKERIIILLGARQVGKTTLMKMIQPELEGDIHYFNLESVADLSLLDEGVRGLQFKGILLPAKKAVLLIDEFQYLQDPNRLFKEIYDTFPEVRILASGSSSLEIQQKIKESLAGRKLTLRVFPLDFYEYLQFLKPGCASFFDHIDLAGEKTRDTVISVKEIRPDFENFVMFGGLPQVVLEPDPETKKLRLEEIVSTYIQKDIKGILKNIEITAFNKLIQVVASQTGNLLNIEELSSTLQLSRREVSHYLEVLGETFVNFLLRPYSTNKRREVVKTPKSFFYDTGVRNQILKHFAPLLLRSDRGALLENAIFLEIQKNLPVSQELYFWRTKNMTEVDFVLRRDDRLFPVEVKAGKESHVPPGLASFSSTHAVDVAFILNDETWKVERHGQVRYYWLPHFLAGQIPRWVSQF